MITGEFGTIVRAGWSGLTGHGKKFWFYSVYNGQSLEGVESGSVMIWLLCGEQTVGKQVWKQGGSLQCFKSMMLVACMAGDMKVERSDQIEGRANGNCWWIGVEWESEEGGKRWLVDWAFGWMMGRLPGWEVLQEEHIWLGNIKRSCLINQWRYGVDSWIVGREVGRKNVLGSLQLLGGI